MKINREKLTFKTGFMENRYINLYGEGDYREEISKQQKRILSRYILVILVFVLAISYGQLEERNNRKAVAVEKGQMVAIVRPEEGASPVVVKAKVVATKNGAYVAQEKELIISPKSGEAEKKEVIDTESPEDVLQRRIGLAVKSLNQNTTTAKVVLPNVLADGTKLRWENQRKGSSPVIFVVMAFMIFAIYKGRFEKIEKAEKKAQDSIKYYLPDFINKLVLLINGGLVFQAAFEKTLEDYSKLKGREGIYFYDQLELINLKSKETNASIHVELRAFAKRSGVRELMRVSNIISDNVHKGNDLGAKLRREGEVLWFMRKKQSEERGRIAETKMTMPLVILLLVLIMITISPALLGI